MDLHAKNPDGPIFLRRRRKNDVEMDITPMIDIVFLLLIFFLVCSTLGRNSMVRLPQARYGVVVDPKTSTILTVAGREDDAVVYLGDGPAIRELSRDHEIQHEEIVEAVRHGLAEGKTGVVVRADRRLHHGEVVRVEASAVSVRGVNLYVVVDDQ